MDWLAEIVKNLNTLNNLPAFYIRDEYYSYQQTKTKILSIAQEINSIENIQNIGIVTGDDFETYSTLLACLLLQKTYVPLNRKNPVQRNINIVSEGKINLVICSDELMRTELINSHQNINVINPLLLKGKLVDLDISYPEFNPNALAYILFTSGSTGKPKGVPITYSNMSAFINKVLSDPLFEYSKTDRFLQMFELSFDPSVFSTITPLYFGACCYVVPDSGMIFHHVFNMFEDHAITVALLTPSVINYLRVYFKEINLPHLKYSMFCGEALHDSVARQWQNCIPNATIHNWYGPTEGTVICLQFNQQKNSDIPANDLMPIGKPLPGIQVILVDEEGQLIDEVNFTGELCIYGDQVINEYWNNPDANLKSFYFHKKLKKLFYKTGDLCEIDVSGNYHYIGRKDFQVKINGYRMELAEIEFFARKFENVSQAIVMKKNDQELVLFIEPLNVSFIQDNLIENLKENLPWYMIPKNIIMVNEMPLNQNMKIDRIKLSALIS